MFDDIEPVFSLDVSLSLFPPRQNLQGSAPSPGKLGTLCWYNATGPDFYFCDPPVGPTSAPTTVPTTSPPPPSPPAPTPSCPLLRGATGGRALRPAAAVSDAHRQAQFAVIPNPCNGPPCDLYKIKYKPLPKYVRPGQTITIRLAIGNPLRAGVINGALAIILPPGVTYVTSTNTIMPGTAPRLVGQYVILDPIMLRPKGSFRFTLTVSVPVNAALGPIHFDVGFFGSNLNCFDRLSILVSEGDADTETEVY